MLVKSNLLMVSHPSQQTTFVRPLDCLHGASWKYPIVSGTALFLQVTETKFSWVPASGIGSINKNIMMMLLLPNILIRFHVSKLVNYF